MEAISETLGRSVTSTDGRAIYSGLGLKPQII
jgi:hypothetical protein